MAKTPSDRLYQLIKSLTPSEKRYFKLQFPDNTGGSTPKFISLFDAIDAQEVFDDEALQLSLYGKKVQSRKFSELKGYLTRQVLQTLVRFDEQQTAMSQLLQYQQQINSLFHRSRFDDCFYLLRKAKKIAQRYEWPSISLQLLNTEKDLYYARADISGLHKNLAEIATAEQLAVLQDEEIRSFHNIFLKLLLIIRQQPVRQSGKLLEDWLETAERDRLHQEEDALTIRAAILSARIASLQYYTAGDFSSFRATGETLLELYGQVPHFIKEDSSDYISILSNLSVSALLLHDPAGVKRYLALLKDVPPASKLDESKIHRQYYTIYFRLCINSGDFEEGLTALETHQSALQKLPSELFARDSFYFQYFYIYFGAGRFDDALDALNQWLSLPRHVERQDLQGLSRLLNLLIHFEMENHQLLQSLTRSSLRFFEQQAEPNAAAIALTQFFKSLSYQDHPRDQQVIFAKMQETLPALLQESGQASAMNLFDFMAWVESKHSKRPFAEVLQAQY